MSVVEPGRICKARRSRWGGEGRRGETNEYIYADLGIALCKHEDLTFSDLVRTPCRLHDLKVLM